MSKTRRHESDATEQAGDPQTPPPAPALVETAAPPTATPTPESDPPSVQAPVTSAVGLPIDEFHGRGGTYVANPKTGERRLLTEN